MIISYLIPFPMICIPEPPSPYLVNWYKPPANTQTEHERIVDEAIRRNVQMTPPTDMKEAVTRMIQAESCMYYAKVAP